MKSKRNMAMLLFLFFLYHLCGTPVFSDENSVSQNIPFLVSTQLPDNQINKQVSYFDLQMEPKQEQTLHLKIENISDQTITLETSLYQGNTNSIGVIEYDKSIKGLANNAQVNIEDLAKIAENKIKISPKQTHELQVKIKMPEKELSGITIGAIRVVQNNEENKEGNIQNNFAREVGLVLQSSDPEKIPSELKFLDAQAEQVNARNVFTEKIQNPKPKLVRLTNLKAVISKEGNQEVIYQANQQEGSIAPNTVLNYRIPLDGKSLLPGAYVATFEADEGAQHWKLTRRFTIKSNTSKKLNQTDILIKSKPSFFAQYKWMIITGCILLGVILVLCIYVGKIKRKLAEQENN
ncbi:DUF916 and DUF3324 domain-containing protein [Enterococcus mundtii]|uniref:Uncharacterized protein n=1 Tax=Enterococcus mundtii TaxID=53346 RepID=A0A2S7RZN3_ENTMU|nr:DUF916 and DUF3324 domain-containing protein [Enterococcus mundtii]PQF25757.1 hypothetical protein CUS89_00125 [Enterococcus mundtii]